MANKIVKDSANWASLWVKEVNLGSVAGSLPGGSAALAINQPYRVGNKAGIVTDVPVLREDGNYWATIDMACLVRISGTSGTATDGATVYINTTTFAITFSATNSVAFGILDRAKAAAGDDIWVQLIPGLAAAA